eukprot:gene12667-biopygen11607
MGGGWGCGRASVRAEAGRLSSFRGAGGRDGRERGKDGKERGKGGREHGKDGREPGRYGRAHGKDGRKRGEDGREHGKDGREHGKDGREHGKDGREHGKDSAVPHPSHGGAALGKARARCSGDGKGHIPPEVIRRRHSQGWALRSSRSLPDLRFIVAHEDPAGAHPLHSLIDVP